MAEADVTIGVASETKAARQGIESGVTQPIEDATRALKELGESNGPEELERNIEEAQKATKNLERETKSTADAIEKEFRSSYAKLKSSSKDGLSKAADTTEEFKDEARQNFSEITSSFNGEMSSIQDFAQGTLGGLASALPGPAAFAAGGAAIGVGVIGGIVSGMNEHSEELQQEIYDEITAAFTAGEEAINNERIKEKFAEYWNDPSFKASAAELAEQIGVDSATIIRAAAGDDVAGEVVSAAVERIRDELGPSKLGRYTNTARTSFEQMFSPIEDKLSAVEEIRRGVDEINYAWLATNTAVTSSHRDLREEVTAPMETSVELVPDSSKLDEAVQKSRTVRVSLEGYTRTGKRIL